jgi:predicted DNA-binding transcriptional regulator YafY
MSKTKKANTYPHVSQPQANVPPDLGLPKCGQTLWARVARMHALLCQQKPFTAVMLAQAFETDKRTIRRTVRFMRDSLGAPIKFDQKANTFRYTREWLFLPLARVTADESFVLKLIRQLLPNEVSSPLGAALQTVLKKFELVVGGEGGFGSGSLEELVVPALLGAAEQRHLPAIQQAIACRRELRIIYLKANATEPDLHALQPHRLRFIRQRWILLAHDVTRRGELRTFLLRRVREAEIATKTFQRPKVFDPDKFLDGNFGAYTGTEDHLIRILLREAAAIAALEEPWHKSQRHIRRPDGSVEITLRLNNLVEVKNEILKWGELAEALEPPALRTAVRQSLVAAMALYSDSAPDRTHAVGNHE